MIPKEKKWCERHQEEKYMNIMWTAPQIECRSCRREELAEMAIQDELDDRDRLLKD
jgi:hypothetical protein